jgi:ABC-type multidrug transport system ATPase subunit
MTAMTDDGVPVLLSSHALAELDRVADYLVLSVLLIAATVWLVRRRAA